MEKGAVAKQRLTGRRLHLSWVKSVPPAPKVVSWERNGFMDAWLTKGTMCRAELEKSLMQKGCGHLILLCLSPHQG